MDTKCENGRAEPLNIEQVSKYGKELKVIRDILSSDGLFELKYISDSWTGRNGALNLKNDNEIISKLNAFKMQHTGYRSSEVPSKSERLNIEAMFESIGKMNLNAYVSAKLGDEELKEVFHVCSNNLIALSKAKVFEDGAVGKLDEPKGYSHETLWKLDVVEPIIEDWISSGEEVGVSCVTETGEVFELSVDFCMGMSLFKNGNFNDIVIAESENMENKFPEIEKRAEEYHRRISGLKSIKKTVERISHDKERLLSFTRGFVAVPFALMNERFLSYLIIEAEKKHGAGLEFCDVVADTLSVIKNEGFSSSLLSKIKEIAMKMDWNSAPSLKFSVPKQKGRF